MKISEEEYQAAIPKCCEFQTTEEHLKFLVLCWGLLESIRMGTTLKCGICEYNKDRDNGTV